MLDVSAPGKRAQQRDPGGELTFGPPSYDHAKLVVAACQLEYLSAGFKSPLPGEEVRGGAEGLARHCQRDSKGVFAPEGIGASDHVPLAGGDDHRRPPYLCHMELQVA
jgi:hypothetical protein